ncbi:MAG: ribulose-phosphate 3-epimerase [Bdellovibrionales bacterium]|nr:ribulose-phosphate 3-epimerase [Bdellovibrionales bacterium]
MARSSLVAPSILAANFGDLKNEIQSVASLGSDWIHIDVMDGSFVPPITFGDNVIKVAKEACNLHLDVHLMVEHPETHMESFAKAGADRFVVHQETCPHLHRTLSAVKKLGMNCGVAINPATPVTTIFDVLDSCELVLIMTVNPGWGGQSFISECVSKIKTLRNEIDSRRLNTLIQVDGGINQETGKQCFDAGADVFVAGSYIFGSQDREAAIKSLKF